MKKELLMIMSLSGIIVWGSGCATLSQFFGFGAAPVADLPKSDPAPVVEKKPDIPRFSENSTYEPVTDKNYQRMTREKMEEDSELQAGAGSLWLMEGQTSYLFAQNKHRTEGDPSTLKIEGYGLKQVKMKAENIKSLLMDLEKQKLEAEAKQRKDNEMKQKQQEILKEKQLILSNNEADNDDAALALAEKRVNERNPASVEKPIVVADEKINYMELEYLPLKITEKLSDGRYRIQAKQIMYIKNKPYQLMATGVVRKDDYTDALVSSEKMADAQFDIVHMKKTE